MTSTFEHEWNILQAEISEWGDATFPNHTVHTRMEHLRREIKEIEASPNDVFEYADVMLIFLHQMQKQNISMQDLLSTCWEKFHIVKRREWGTPDEHGVVEHERGEN